MLEIDLTGVMARAVYCALTLYMMAILLRWLAPYLQVDIYHPRLRWIRQMTDPFLDFMRRRLPVMGPFDFAPVAAIFAAWLVRTLLVAMIIRAAAAG